MVVERRTQGKSSKRGPKLTDIDPLLLTSIWMRVLESVSNLRDFLDGHIILSGVIESVFKLDGRNI